MQIKVQNSLALRIPKTYAADIQLHRGSVVDMLETEGRLIIEPVKASETTLEQLLAGITKENIHREIETGAHAGNEVW